MGSWNHHISPTAEEVFQLITGLSAEGFISLAEEVSEKYADRNPMLVEGETGGDIMRSLALGHLRLGDPNKASNLLEKAFSIHYEVSSGTKVALDEVASARVHLTAGNRPEALRRVRNARSRAVEESSPVSVIRHISYWLALVEVSVIGRVPLEVVGTVAESDRAEHRRQIANKLLSGRSPEKTAHEAARRENTLGRLARTRAERKSAHGVYF